MRPGESYRQFSTRVHEAAMASLNHIAKDDKKLAPKRKEYERISCSCQISSPHPRSNSNSTYQDLFSFVYFLDIWIRKKPASAAPMMMMNLPTT